MGIGAGIKNLSDGATGRRKKFEDIFSRVDRIYQRDRRTDRHRATAKTALTQGRRAVKTVKRMSNTDWGLYFHVRCILL